MGERAQDPTIYGSKAQAWPSEHAGFVAAACRATPKAVSSQRAHREPAERNGAKTERVARDMTKYNYRQKCLPRLLFGLMEVFAGEIFNEKLDVCVFKE